MYLSFFFHRSVNALVCEMSYCETVPFIISSSINIILKFKQCKEQTNCEKTLECAKTLFCYSPYITTWKIPNSEWHCDFDCLSSWITWLKNRVSKINNTVLSAYSAHLRIWVEFKNVGWTKLKFYLCQNEEWLILKEKKIIKYLLRIY